jgi:spore germination protein GerM
MAKARKDPISRPTLLLIVMAAVILVLVIVFFLGGRGEKLKPFIEANVPKSPGVSEKEAGTRPVMLFFLSDDDDLLHEEKREIPAGPTTADEAERALDELIKGSEKGYVSPLPPQTKVRQVFVGKDGLATVDFSREIAEKYAYGSTSELAAVYAIVDTLVYNFKPIKKVVILIEGSERDTLGGHIDLSRAFFPDYSLIAR